VREHAHYAARPACDTASGQAETWLRSSLKRLSDSPGSIQTARPGVAPSAADGTNRRRLLTRARKAPNSSQRMIHQRLAALMMRHLAGEATPELGYLRADTLCGSPGLSRK
jgi:hypothetical protein